MRLEIKFLDIVAMQKELQFRIPNDNKCHACISYLKRNNSHGTCKVFDTATCPDASCGKYKYYKENRKL